MPQDSKNFWVRKLHALNMTVDSHIEWKLYIKRDLSLHDYSTYSPWKIQGTSPLGPGYEFLQLGELQMCLRGKCICDQWKHKRGRKVARLHRPPEISSPCASKALPPFWKMLVFYHCTWYHILWDEICQLSIELFIYKTCQVSKGTGMQLVIKEISAF